VNAIFSPSPSSLDLRSVAETAAAAGFAAIELTASDDPAAPSATNLLWSSPGAIARNLGDVKVGSVAAFGDWPAIKRAAIAAAAVGCRLVRVTGLDVSTTRDHCSIAHEVAEVASSQDVVIVIEPSASRHGTTDLWTFLDAVGHPALGCCWIETASAVPNVSIPVLSNWIRAARITSLEKTAIDRLHGIGFGGPWIIGPSTGSELLRKFATAGKM
jgi:sugar phosphate isomerase/epimerase